MTYDLGVMDDWAPSVALSKVSFASNYLYDVGMGFPKMSILAFYWGTHEVLKLYLYQYPKRDASS